MKISKLRWFKRVLSKCLKYYCQCTCDTGRQTGSVHQTTTCPPLCGRFSSWLWFPETKLTPVMLTQQRCWLTSADCCQLFSHLRRRRKKKKPLLQMSSKTELSLLKLKWECAEWEEELERKQREESLAELPEGRPEFTATERGNGKIKESVCYHRETHVLTWCCQYNKTCT